jgi:hypothetical protein
MSKAHSRATLLNWRQSLKTPSPYHKSSYNDGLSAAARQKLWYAENKYRLN